ncbi:hypothetical protein LOZ66_005190 [Ophidiomyces ophidiicola]|nr:hypothetical protein LOZ66_005190 [Ophidiomyces ophidiicola]
MSTANYTIELPKTAIIVTTWVEYHTEAAILDYMVIPKYGGYVIEIDGEIKLATDDNMTKLIKAKLDSLTPLEGSDVDEPQSSDNTNHLQKRRCSHPPCFNNSLCLTCTDCHVCTGVVERPVCKRGRCI